MYKFNTSLFRITINKYELLVKTKELWKNYKKHWGTFDVRIGFILQIEKNWKISVLKIKSTPIGLWEKRNSEHDDNVQEMNAKKKSKLPPSLYSKTTRCHLAFTNSLWGLRNLFLNFSNRLLCIIFFYIDKRNKNKKKNQFSHQL